MRRGFTLIELLVVIGIIAVLAAIIFPVFASCREKARQMSCLSNLRQLGMAMRNYENDWGGYAQCRSNRYSNWVGYDGYMPGDVLVPKPIPETGSLWPYVHSCGVYHCPCDGVGTVSYAVNLCLTLGANVNDPSKTGMFADMNYGFAWFMPKNYGSMVRHGNGYNAVYVDGHAKYRIYPLDCTAESHEFFTGGDPRWEPPH